MNFIRTLLHSRRAPLGVMVIAVIALGSLTGVALAQEPSDQSAAGDSSTSSDPTTSSTDPTTTSTADPTTSTTDPTTTTTDSDTSAQSSDESSNLSNQTTTTSDELNSLMMGANTRVKPTSTDEKCPKAEGNFTEGQIEEVVVTTGLTLTFTFDTVNGDGEATGATWNSSAPFTGDIIVKSGSENNGGGEITYGYTNESSGTVSNTFTNQNGGTFGISHIEVCGTTGTTTTTSTTTTTDTTTETTTTDTTTTDTTTDTTDTTGTTTTGTTSSTGGTAGTSATGSTNVPTNDGNAPKAKTTNAAAVAGEVTKASGGLPFTGLHAPL